MLGPDGRVLWTKAPAKVWRGPFVSGDGKFLYVEEVDEPSASSAAGALVRIAVIDADTGLTAYRVRGVFCTEGWVADTHEIIVYAEDGVEQVLVNLDDRSVRRLAIGSASLWPTPFDRTRAILVDFGAGDLYWYDLSTGETTLIANTDGSVIWDPVVGIAFAGTRLVLTAPIFGHGGCLEASIAPNPPPPEVLIGPFGDDAPVTYGPGQ